MSDSPAARTLKSLKRAVIPLAMALVAALSAGCRAGGLAATRQRRGPLLPRS